MGTIHAGVNRSETFAGYSTLEVEVCTCGVLFAAPKQLLDRCRQTGEGFYCPNGHVLVYGSENEKLKKKLAAEKDARARVQARLDQEQMHSRAMRGVVTKTKNKLAATEQRIANGVCPCCGRTFKELARHMKTKHPEYVSEAAASRKGPVS